MRSFKRAPGEGLGFDYLNFTTKPVEHLFAVSKFLVAMNAAVLSFLFVAVNGDRSQNDEQIREYLTTAMAECMISTALAGFSILTFLIFCIVANTVKNPRYYLMRYFSVIHIAGILMFLMNMLSLFFFLLAIADLGMASGVIGGGDLKKAFDLR